MSDSLDLSGWVSFDDQPALRWRVHDLRCTLVREYLRDTRSPLGAEPDDRELYRMMQLVWRINGEELPRNVSLLFFSDSPDRVFPGARIDVVRFPEGAGGDILEERIVRGPLHHQVRDCLAILRNLVTQTVRKHPDRPEATTWYDYPIAAVEEVVANTVHHRDYRADQPIKVYLYPDEMVITSYPGPVPGIKLEHFAPGKRIPQAPARNRSSLSIPKAGRAPPLADEAAWRSRSSVLPLSPGHTPWAGRRGYALPLRRSTAFPQRKATARNGKR